MSAQCPDISLCGRRVQTKPIDHNTSHDSNQARFYIPGIAECARNAKLAVWGHLQEIYGANKRQQALAILRFPNVDESSRLSRHNAQVVIENEHRFDGTGVPLQTSCHSLVTVSCMID